VASVSGWLAPKGALARFQQGIEDRLGRDGPAARSHAHTMCRRHNARRQHDEQRADRHAAHRMPSAVDHTQDHMPVASPNDSDSTSVKTLNDSCSPGRKPPRCDIARQGLRVSRPDLTFRRCAASSCKGKLSR
jgi:hypothetical protein